jgi:PAS domain S-box-containing protein
VDAFPGYMEPISNVLSAGGGFLRMPGAEGEIVAYLTTRVLDPRDPKRRLVFVLTEPIEQLFESVGLIRRDNLLWMGGLLSVPIVLVVVMVRRMTRSLGALANESKAIARGDYQVALPAADDSEIGSVILAFRHMAAEVERREEALAKLNQDLARRVEERTRELARQHNLQQLILENIADGIVVSDRNGHFLLWNHKAEQILGSGPEEVPPEHWSAHFGLFRDETGILIPAEELPLVRAVRGESTSNAELYLCNPKRTEGRWAQITARPLRSANGDISGAVAVLVDVTEHKRMQARIKGHRNELAEVGRRAFSLEIASSVAHKLSQPIAAMCNYAGAAVRLHKQGRLGEDELSEILTRIEHLSIKSGEILDTLRARIRRREHATTSFDVNAVAASCLDLLKGRFEQQGVRVECRYAQGLPQLIGDPIELEQVLIQLASNALEAMEGTARDERRLWVGTGLDAETGLVKIEVGDSGPGVSAAIAERLFEPWETDKPKALGIGLSIAQTIVETFGGQIRMLRATTGGALFRVELPVAGDSQG